MCGIFFGKGGKFDVFHSRKTKPQQLMRHGQERSALILLLSERHADVRSAVAGEQPFDFVSVVKLDAVYALARKFAVDAEKPLAAPHAPFSRP